MLTRTFLHSAGVGKIVENKLWLSGFQDWSAFLAREQADTPKVNSIRNTLLQSVIALKSHDHRFFSNALPVSEHWRLFKTFKDNTAYVDIETTGLSPEHSEITTIALYDGRTIKHYVNGQNLKAFVKDIKLYDLLVTYNGKCFDVPMIQHYFGIELPHSHIDLRSVLASLGYKGGLKACEKSLGIARSELEGVDGYMAVNLWDEYQDGKKSALDTLLAYNIEDVINLEYLMHTAYNLKVRGFGFNDEVLQVPARPKVPFKVDLKLIAKLKAEFGPSIYFTK